MKLQNYESIYSLYAGILIAIAGIQTIRSHIVKQVRDKFSLIEALRTKAIEKCDSEISTIEDFINKKKVSKKNAQLVLKIQNRIKKNRKKCNKIYFFPKHELSTMIQRITAISIFGFTYYMIVLVIAGLGKDGILYQTEANFIAMQVSSLFFSALIGVVFLTSVNVDYYVDGDDTVPTILEVSNIFKLRIMLLLILALFCITILSIYRIIKNRPNGYSDNGFHEWLLHQDGIYKFWGNEIFALIFSISFFFVLIYFIFSRLIYWIMIKYYFQLFVFKSILKDKKTAKSLDKLMSA